MFKKGLLLLLILLSVLSNIALAVLVDEEFYGRSQCEASYQYSSNDSGDNAGKTCHCYYYSGMHCVIDGGGGSR